MSKHRLLPALASTALLVATASSAAASSGQTVTDLSGSLTAEDLVEAFIGDTTVHSNVVYTGSPFAAGTFSGFGSIGIESGIVLSTGCVTDGNDTSYEVACDEGSSILGPNLEEYNTGQTWAGGNQDLSDLLGGAITLDAAVLEFDFVPTAEQITFSYIFGSEEYPEFVGDDYNDVFAFFINGVNYAHVPGTTDPVSINNVNAATNPGYFVKNYFSTSGSPFDAEINGFTTVLEFTAPVNIGVPNHIKLAIADVADDALDSSVLLKAGSFSATNTPPVANPASVTTPVDTPVDITLTGSDADGDTLTFTVLTPPDPDEGTFTATPNGVGTFTPAPGFTGEVTFTFIANDGKADSEPATITVQVTRKQDPTPTPTPTDPTPTHTPTPTDPTDPTPTEPTLTKSTSTLPAVPTTDPGKEIPPLGANPASGSLWTAGILALVGTAILFTRRALANR